MRLKVDVIVATGSPVYRALQHSTTIPVVVTLTFDPVGDGYAASMARPGGNFTGLSISAGDLGPKMLELLKAAVPKMSSVAMLSNPSKRSGFKFGWRRPAQSRKSSANSP